MVDPNDLRVRCFADGVLKSYLLDRSKAKLMLWLIVRLLLGHTTTVNLLPVHLLLCLIQVVWLINLIILDGVSVHLLLLVSENWRVLEHLYVGTCCTQLPICTTWRYWRSIWKLYISLRSTTWWLLWRHVSRRWLMLWLILWISLIHRIALVSSVLDVLLHGHSWLKNLSRLRLPSLNWLIPLDEDAGCTR